MTFCIRRREFIAALGSATVGPLPLSAQQAALPVIGFFNSGSLDRYRLLLAAFRRLLCWIDWRGWVSRR